MKNKAINSEKQSFESLSRSPPLLCPCQKLFIISRSDFFFFFFAPNSQLPPELRYSILLEETARENKEGSIDITMEIENDFSDEGEFLRRRFLF